MLTALTVNLKQGQDVSGTPQVAPRELWRSLGPLMRPYRLQLAATLALAIVSPLLDTVAISLYGRLVDDVLVPRSLEMLGPIAMAYLAANHAVVGHEVHAVVRGQRLPMRVSPLPFAPHRYLRRAAG